MVARSVRWRSGRSRAPPVNIWNRRSNLASNACGDRSLMRAAASSRARGNPSRRTQISATAGALVFVTWKSGLTACARSIKSATDSYCESATRSGRRLVSGSASAGTGNSRSARTCSPSRLVTRTFSRGQTASRSATCMAALTTCSKLSSSSSVFFSWRELFKCSSGDWSRASRRPSVRAYLSQAHSLWQGMLHQIARGLGEQDLSAVTSAHDACGPMHVQADVALSRMLRLAGVQAHAHLYRHSFRPGMGAEGTLTSDRCRDGIGGARKGHEERIPLRVDLVTMEFEERGTQEGAAHFQEASVALTHLLEQARRALDIGEEQGDGSHREFTHAAPPFAGAHHTLDTPGPLASTLALIVSASLYLIIHSRK